MCAICDWMPEIIFQMYAMSVNGAGCDAREYLRISMRYSWHWRYVGSDVCRLSACWVVLLLLLLQPTMPIWTKRHVFSVIIFTCTHSTQHTYTHLYILPVRVSYSVSHSVSSPCLDFQISTLFLAISNKTEYSHSHHDVFFTYLMGIRCAWEVERCSLRFFFPFSFHLPCVVRD